MHCTRRQQRYDALVMFTRVKMCIFLLDHKHFLRWIIFIMIFEIHLGLRYSNRFIQDVIINRLCVKLFTYQNFGEPSVQFGSIGHRLSRSASYAGLTDMMLGFRSYCNYIGDRRWFLLMFWACQTHRSNTGTLKKGF